MKAGEERRLTVHSCVENIRVIAEFTRDAVSPRFNENDSTAIEVAIVEAANNILKHSYSLESGHPITLYIHYNGREMEFTFQDQGMPFDPSEIKPVELSWNNIHDIPESGRGIYIIKEIMDSVNYSRSGDINSLKLLKIVKEPQGNINQQIIDRKSTQEESIEKIKADMAINEVALEEMAEELSSAYESLNLFYALSKDVALISNIDTFLQNTLEKVLNASGADWGVVRLAEGQNLRLYSATKKCPDIALQEFISINDESSIEGKVTHSMGIELANSYHDREGALLCLPIVGLDAFIGTILLGKSSSGEKFSSGDAKLTRALADQIAVSIENSRLYKKAMDVELAEKEMEIATNLQKKLILEKLPTMPGLDIYTKIDSAKQVGGDYLTIYKIDKNILYFAVCDAMGKGMSASYFSLLSHMAIHSIIVQQNMKKMTPGTLLTLMNKIMGRDFDLFGMFMTSFIGKINIAKNQLEYASAGHCQPIYYTPSNDKISILDTSDFMLGVEKDTQYKDFKIQFKKGTKFLVYSDGLTDISDKSGEMIGIEALAKVCEAEFRTKSINDACEKIYQTVLETSGGVLQDDISMIGIERVK